MINKKNYMTANCSINCPVCGHIAKLFDSYDAEKERIECPVCGYIEETNKIFNTKESIKGYGVIFISYKNKPFFNEFFERELNEKEIEYYLSLFEDVFVIQEESYFYIYNQEKNSIKVLKGRYPQTFDDFVENKRNETEYDRFLNSYRFLSSSNEEELF